MSYSIDSPRDVHQRVEITEELKNYLSEEKKQKVWNQVYGKRHRNIHSDFKDRIKELQNSIK